MTICVYFTCICQEDREFDYNFTWMHIYMEVCHLCLILSIYVVIISYWAHACIIRHVLKFKLMFWKGFPSCMEPLSSILLKPWCWRKIVYKPYIHRSLNSILAKSMSFELRVCKWSCIGVLEKFFKLFWSRYAWV